MRRRRWGIAAVAAGLAASWILGAGPVGDTKADQTLADQTGPAATGQGAAGRAAGERAAADPAADARLARFYRQQLAWHGCQLGPEDEEGQALDQAGAECAEVTVPLDYSKPNRRDIEVAIVRIQATDTARRIGAVVLNLGGPALPVFGTVPLVQQVMGESGPRFDVVGMDPRFAGRSTPAIDCGWPSGATRSAGADRESFDRTVTLARDLAKRCGEHRDLLPHASTRNSARDLDVIRGALGDPKLSYIGVSYGTHLGAAYTQLFPHRADRIVLDSAIDPALIGTLAARSPEVAPAREAALRDWAGLAAQFDDQLGLGATAEEVLSVVEQIYQSSAENPLQVGQHSVDDTLLPVLLLDPLSDDSDGSNLELAETVQVLAQAAAGVPAEPTPSMDAALTGVDSAIRSVRTAIQCADAPVSRDPERYYRDVEASRASAPLFGPHGGAITPCAFWPVAAKPQTPIGNSVPALIVQAAGDINATLENGQAMHRALTGSRMITLDGVRTHGVYGFAGSACVDDAVNAYLGTGALPGQDLTCERPPDR